MTKTFYSNGKLLLTGEYLVLDGAKALAIPTRFGQSMVIETIAENNIYWQSKNDKDTIWFKAVLNIKNFESSKKLKSNNEITNKLFKILSSAKKLNPNFLSTENGFKITTELDFPRDWGLGSSSTLINNIAQWAQVDAQTLLQESFGGSGYDIACAQNNNPILFQLQNSTPKIEPIKLDWDFTNVLFFVYLNKKQDSKKGIQLYRNASFSKVEAVSQISKFTDSLLLSDSVSAFENTIEKHEAYISKILKLQTVKELHFSDYQGAIKSLGAWGGDFILATGDKSNWEYFRKKGYKTIIAFDDMIL